MPQAGLGVSQLFTIDEISRLARLAEQYEFSRLYCPDNLYMKPVWPLLTVMAQNTSRLDIGPLVTHPFLYHPLQTAGMLAELDEISGGRAFLGFGRGAFYERLGMEPIRKPVTTVREAIELIYHFLRLEEQPYNGTVFNATGEARLLWQPPRSDVPLIIGTWGPKLLELAGERAIEVDLGFLLNTGYLETVHRHVEIGAQRLGRDPAEVHIGVGSICSISEDRQAAYALAKRTITVFLNLLVTFPGFPSVPQDELDGVAAGLRAGGPEAAAKAISDETAYNYCLLGTPDEVLSRCQELVADGIDHIGFGFPLGPDREQAVHLIGTKVLPKLLS